MEKSLKIDRATLEKQSINESMTKIVNGKEYILTKVNHQAVDECLTWEEVFAQLHKQDGTKVGP